MLGAILSAAAGPLGGKAADLIKEKVTAELFDKDGNKVEVSPGKTPSRALATAILATADLIEAAGGTDQDRIDAAEATLQSYFSIVEGDGQIDDDDDEQEPPG